MLFRSGNSIIIELPPLLEDSNSRNFDLSNPRLKKEMRLALLRWMSQKLMKASAPRASAVRCSLTFSNVLMAESGDPSPSRLMAYDAFHLADQLLTQPLQIIVCL